MCLKRADKGCEGQFVAFSFRGQRVGRSPQQVATSLDGCKMNVSNVN